MMQTHLQLKKISEEYNSLFSKNEFYPVQKAYSTPHFLVLSLRFPGKSIALYIGRGHQYQGAFLGEKLPPSYLRIQDKMLDYLRKYLVGARLGKMEVDQKGMLFYFPFKNEHTKNAFIFGYKDRQLYFVHQNGNSIYQAHDGKVLLDRELSDVLAELETDKGSSTEDRIENVEDYLKEEAKKINGQPLQKKKEKFVLRKIKNIFDDLEKVKKWAELQDDLLHDRLDLSGHEIHVHEQKIKFHGDLGPWEKKDQLFKKIKKLKRAQQILEERLRETEEELVKIRRGEFEFDITKERAIPLLWQTAKVSSKTDEGFNIKNFKMENINGLLGLDAKSNDHLRCTCFKEHYWFHLENYPGAHCVLKTDDLSKLSLHHYNALASMLRDLSKLSILNIPVLYTQLKNIKGIKGSRGEVSIKKAKHLECVYINWKEIISIL